MDESSDDEQPLPGALVVGVALVMTLLLSVWAAFLVPLRLLGVPVPLWLVPLGLMLALAAAAGRQVGTLGAALPAGVWLVVSWLGFGSTRAEGDLVVPGTLSGYAYLFGGLALWLLVVVRASPRPGPRR